MDEIMKEAISPTLKGGNQLVSYLVSQLNKMGLNYLDTLGLTTI